MIDNPSPSKPTPTPPPHAPQKKTNIPMANPYRNSPAFKARQLANAAPCKSPPIQDPTENSKSLPVATSNKVYHNPYKNMKWYNMHMKMAIGMAHYVINEKKTKARTEKKRKAEEEKNASKKKHPSQIQKPPHTGHAITRFFQPRPKND